MFAGRQSQQQPSTPARVGSAGRHATDPAPEGSIGSGLLPVSRSGAYIMRQTAAAVALLAVLAMLATQSAAKRKTAAQWQAMKDEDWEEAEDGERAY